jgi:hypothetical protein
MGKSMNFIRTFLPVLVAVGMFSSTLLSAQAGLSDRPFINHVNDKELNSRHDTELSERDWQDLYDFINTKRTINLAEKGQNLTIAGDVRFVWRNLNEKDPDGHNRGKNHTDQDGIRLGRNDFDIRFNLYFDYVCDRSWAVAQLEFDNSAGVGFNDNMDNDPEGMHGSGFCCDLCLKKAYIGYNVCCGGDSRFDIEIGRRHLYHVFDSEIEFLSRFDGVLLRYSGSWDCLFNYHLYLGGFIIDERVNHFGWVTELGVFNVCDSGFDFLYSFIDWKKNGKNRYGEHDPNGCKYLISQWLLKYHLDPSYTNCIPSHFYGAFLWNHDAPSHNGKRRGKGWYAGYRIGSVSKCGDWALDLQYQYVQPYAIPDQDISGIGRGNEYDTTVTMDERRGNGNYKGWRVEGLYALTNDLVIDASFEASRAVDKWVGDMHHFHQLEVELIYAF